MGMHSLHYNIKCLSCSLFASSNMFHLFLTKNPHIIGILRPRTFSAIGTSSRKTKRFYKNVSITQNGGFEINLDQRKLKTPLGNIFQIQNEALAIAVATEWDGQKENIERHNMHLTHLCNAAIDNPMQKTANDMVLSMLHYLNTDTVCYRMEEPEALFTLQCDKWDPVINYVETKYNVSIPTSTSILGVTVPQTTHNTLYRYLASHHIWTLTGYNQATEILKSLILCLALMDRYYTIDEALDLSLLELEFQTSRWGNVEWGHDINRHEMRSRLSAAVLFTHLSTQSSHLKEKLSDDQLSYQASITSS